MFWRIDCSVEKFDPALSAGPAPSAGGIDMDACLHGGLKEVLLLIYRNFSLTGVESYIMLRHDVSNYNPIPPRFRWRRDWEMVLNDAITNKALLLEKPTHFASIYININPSEGGVRAGSRHQTDGPRYRAEESRTAKDQDIPNRKDPAFGHSLTGWIMG